MDNKNLMPQAAQPVNRISSGQLPSELAELSEEALSQLGDGADASNKSVLASSRASTSGARGMCSYDGDDAE